MSYSEDRVYGQMGTMRSQGERCRRNQGEEVQATFASSFEK
jgi:hypothetical protein